VKLQTDTITFQPLDRGVDDSSAVSIPPPAFVAMLLIEPGAKLRRPANHFDYAARDPVYTAR